ncbi:MAG: hypothetical protein H6739_09130 [Alphaproteobacteria bacterium]|nr:hypothetical protein [Alphaproteobacteria bacterium]
MSLHITGLAARSGAGRGVDALAALLREGGHAFSAAPPYDAAGLASPQCAQVEGLDRTAPATTLLTEAVTDALADAGLDPKAARVGLVVGTSSGDISGPWERWHAAVHQGDPPAEPERGRDGPTLAVGQALGLGPVATVSIACASGTAAFALAQAWLLEVRADAVVVAGVDALSRYIHAGFNGLGALSAATPRPFHPDRDGLTLGEGAAALVLEPAERAAARGARARAALLGVGLAADAVHMTAPHREGRGAAAAIRAALDDAGLQPGDIDMVSVHGTGTVFNDNMEAFALREVFGARPVPFHGVKQAIGHTLGAAGAIEAAVVVDALERGVQPPPPPVIADDLPVARPPARPPAPRVALSTNAAFGGSNAAVVLARPDVAGPKRAPRDTVTAARAELVVPAGPVDWRALWPDPPERFRRMHRYVRLGMVALHRLLEALDAPPAPSWALVLASRTNCRSVDLRYHARLLDRGAAAASRVDFVYTIPGAPIAEASIHWGLRGPSLALVGDPEEAEVEAHRLVRWGHAPAALALGMELPEGDAAGFARVALVRATD